MPDSFECLVAANAALFEKLAAKDRELEELRAKLAASEAACMQAARDIATSNALHAQAEHDLETERGAHERAKIALEDAQAMVAAYSKIAERLHGQVANLHEGVPQEPHLALANAEQTIADYRRIVERLRRQVEDLKKHIRQDLRAVDMEFQTAFHQVLGAMASLGVAFKKATGLDPLDAQRAGRELDPDEYARISSELIEKFADSSRPIPSLPPPSIPFPLAPRATSIVSSRSPRPEEVATLADNDVDNPENPGRVTVGFEELALPTRH